MSVVAVGTSAERCRASIASSFASRVLRLSVWHLSFVRIRAINHGELFLRGSEVRQSTQDFRLGGDGGVRLTMLDRRSSANHQRWHIVRRCIKSGWTSGCLALKLGSLCVHGNEQLWRRSTGPSRDAPQNSFRCCLRLSNFPYCKKQTRSMGIFGLVRSLSQNSRPSRSFGPSSLAFEQIEEVSGCL